MPLLVSSNTISSQSLLTNQYPVLYSIRSGGGKGVSVYVPQCHSIPISHLPLRPIPGAAPHLIRIVCTACTVRVQYKFFAHLVCFLRITSCTAEISGGGGGNSPVTRRLEVSKMRVPFTDQTCRRKAAPEKEQRPRVAAFLRISRPDSTLDGSQFNRGLSLTCC
jgi:hypothetical protein